MNLFGPISDRATRSQAARPAMNAATETDRALVD
ncbi:RNA polymerase subunit sigma, partial [Mesorhizobium sp. M2D.F.Ca.ET.225.01.1.1]